MLDRIVRYLHDAFVPFRISSYPSPEHLPKAAQAIPKFAIQVDSRAVLVGDKLTILCFAASDSADLSALTNELEVSVRDAAPEDLPEELRGLEGSLPPLGGMFKLPLIVDEKVSQCAAIVFSPFGESDYVEIPYDDFARQEDPRVASFGRAGELPERTTEGAAAPPPAG